MKQITSHEGVMLEIEYDPDESLGMAKLGPIIHSARVLDDYYRATGPNLVAFLDKCYLETGLAQASKFLSVVAEELA